MSHARIAAACGLALLAGCAAQPLPADDVSMQRLAGAWRIARATEPASFSDYVLGKAGELTHLRSVVDGVTVDVAHGAGRVEGVGGAMSCLFGSTWSTPGPERLVIDGTCSDGAARELPLRFAAEEVARPGTQKVYTMADAAWVAPTAWTFQKCDDRPCE